MVLKHSSPAPGLTSRAVRRVPPSVRRALNPVRDSVRAGLVSASARMGRIGPVPDYLVIGAQRSGTTWLQRLLVTHPDIVAPRTKEVHYFDQHWHLGLRWYQANFTPAANVARRRPGPRREVRTGEATPYTLFHPLGPSRVASTVPDAQLVVVLRDPVQRAWSHWRHARHLGVEAETFARAVELEEHRLHGADELLRTYPSARHGSHQHHSYLARGRYALQLESWYEHVLRNRLLIVWFDDLVRLPGDSIARVLDHIDARPFAADPTIAPPSNRTAPLDPALAAELRSRFDDDDRALGDLLGAVPPWRR